MTNVINPQEISLLEKYTSLDYMAQLRDTWGEMVTHLEECLSRFMLSLPDNYRNLPLPEQPDRSWGERILPNFRSTFDHLCSGVIAVSHGDVTGLREASRVMNDFAGQREYSSDWLSKDDGNRYFALLMRANTMAMNIVASEDPFWRPGDLTIHLDDGEKTELPSTFPRYELDRSTKVKTGDPVPATGIYVPDAEASCAQYLCSYKDAPEATILTGTEPLIDDETGEQYDEEDLFDTVPCVWTRVRRMAEDGAVRPPPTMFDPGSLRIAAGSPCPLAGYYFTPARQGSRRAFQQGEVMPDFDSAYGATIWQWDPQQS